MWHEGLKNKWLTSYHHKNATKTMETTITHLKIYVGHSAREWSCLCFLSYYSESVPIFFCLLFTIMRFLSTVFYNLASLYGLFSSFWSIWPWFLCFFALESEKHTICKANSKQGETALPSGTSGRLPSVDKQRHPLRMQHLSGRVKETLEGEPASKAASKAASGIFPPLHRNIYGIENDHKRRSNNTT